MYDGNLVKELSNLRKSLDEMIKVLQTRVCRDGNYVQKGV